MRLTGLYDIISTPLTLLSASLLFLCGCANENGESPPRPTAATWTPGELEAIVNEIESSTSETDPVEDMSSAIEGLVSVCMNEAGFDYTPITTLPVSDLSSDLDFSLRDRASAATEGYGIASEGFGPGERSTTASSNPNDAYRESLSAAGLQEYEAALYGSVTETQSDEYEWRSAGCYGWAEHAVAGRAPSVDASGGLKEEIDIFWLSLADDPRLVEVNDAWRSCMERSGYVGLSNPNTAPAELWLEYEALGSEQSTTMLEIDEFREREIRQATDDFDCRESTHYSAEVMRIEHELQSEFVEMHRSELDAWLAATSG